MVCGRKKVFEGKWWFKKEKKIDKGGRGQDLKGCILYKGVWFLF